MSEEPTAVAAPVTTEAVLPEQAEPSAPTTTVPSTSEETPTPEAAPVAQTPDWREELNKADAKELRKHERIAGLIGQEIQRDRQTRKQQEEAAQQAKVREETEQELLKFSEENADYIKEHYPKAYEHLTNLQLQRADREKTGLRTQTVNELATNIGRAMHDVPEWKELTDEDHQKLAAALTGKSDEEAISIFNRMAVDMVAERRLAKGLENFKQKELAKEREAIRQEEAAKLLRTSEAPEIAKPKSTPAQINVKDMPDTEFNDFWRKHFE